jgi:hypothetical protein
MLPAVPSELPIQILAGPDALAELRDGGLDRERVRAFVGASGGPKWLVLHGLDRVLFPWLVAERNAPLHAIGSSIGSWRAACLTTDDPAAAIARMGEAYIQQRYEGRPAPSVVSAEGVRILTAALGERGHLGIGEHPRVRLHVVTARFRHLGAMEGRAQTLGLGVAALLNAVDRRALGGALQRVVFDAGGDPGPFSPFGALPTRHVALTDENALPALHASAAIPAVMSGVVDPPGAPRGTYRDGGVADYHFGPEIDVDEGLTLYPHFYAHMVPGWFDKALPWRRTRGLRRVVLIAPSDAHVASLPGGRIPDRKDFERMGDSERIDAWHRAVALGERMGAAFMELLESGRLGDVAKPLE